MNVPVCVLWPGWPAYTAWYGSWDQKSDIRRPDCGGGAGESHEGNRVCCFWGWYLQGKGLILPLVSSPPLCSRHRFCCRSFCPPICMGPSARSSNQAARGHRAACLDSSLSIEDFFHLLLEQPNHIRFINVLHFISLWSTSIRNHEGTVLCLHRTDQMVIILRKLVYWEITEDVNKRRDDHVCVNVTTHVPISVFAAFWRPLREPRQLLPPEWWPCLLPTVLHNTAAVAHQ